MAFVLIGSLLMACLSLAQAFYILRTGRLHPFFLAPKTTAQAEPITARRMGYALTYMIPGGAVLAILATALLRADKHSVSKWMTIHLQVLIVSLTLILSGFAFVVRPQIIIKSAKGAYPELDENNSSVVAIARLIGAGFIGMGVFILAMLKR